MKLKMYSYLYKKTKNLSYNKSMIIMNKLKISNNYINYF